MSTALPPEYKRSWRKDFTRSDQEKFTRWILIRRPDFRETLAEEIG